MMYILKKLSFYMVAFMFFSALVISDPVKAVWGFNKDNSFIARVEDIDLDYDEYDLIEPHMKELNLAPHAFREGRVYLAQFKDGKFCEFLSFSAIAEVMKILGTAPSFCCHARLDPERDEIYKSELAKLGVKI